MLEEYDYNDFVYDAEKKAYVNKDFKEGENEIVVKFENGQIVSL